MKLILTLCDITVTYTTWKYNVMQPETNYIFDYLPSYWKSILTYPPSPRVLLIRDIIANYATQKYHFMQFKTTHIFD